MAVADREADVAAFNTQIPTTKPAGTRQPVGDDVWATAQGLRALLRDYDAAPLAAVPAGATITVIQARGDFGATAGSYPAARPTPRADVTVIWKGATDPGTRALAGVDEWKRV